MKNPLAISLISGFFLRAVQSVAAENTQERRFLKGKPNSGGGGGATTCDAAVPTEWYNPYEDCATPIAGTTMGASKTTRWMLIEPGACVVLDPYDNSGYTVGTDKICFDSGSGNDIGLLLNGWVEGGGDAYQHECKQGTPYYGLDPAVPVPVSYIAGSDKISVEVLDSAGNLIDSDSVGGCDTSSGVWWRDDNNGCNPLYQSGGVTIRVSNTGNSAKNVRLSTRCNFETCKGNPGALPACV